MPTVSTGPCLGRVAEPAGPLAAAAGLQVGAGAGTGTGRGADLHGLGGQLDHVLHALTVVVPRLLLVDHVPLVLGEVQEAADGAEVLPQRAVLRAWVLLPAEQLTEPALRRGALVSHRGHSSPGLDSDDHARASSLVRDFNMPSSMTPLPHSPYNAFEGLT